MVPFESIAPATPKGRGRKKGAARRERKRKPTDATFELLSGTSPSQILARIDQGDPLGLKPMCIERVRARAQLVALERLHARSLARTAYAAFLRPVSAPLRPWLLERVDGAFSELLREDRDELVAGKDVIRPVDWRYQFLANAMSVTCEVARKACVVFNGLPDDVRSDYWALLVEEKHLEVHAAGKPMHIPQILANTRRAALALARLKDPGQQPLDPGGTHA